MVLYKTTVIPQTPYNGVDKREYYNGISVDTGNKAIAPVGQAIQNEARGGWHLHSIECLPQTITRKKTIVETLLGWIPILGGLLCRNMDECTNGRNLYLYVLVFAKEE